MSWAEFQIRAYAYQRMQEKKDLRAREVAWSALIAPNADPKKLPRTKDKFWQIGIKETTITDDMRERIREAQEKYKKDKNGVR